MKQLLNKGKEYFKDKNKLIMMGVIFFTLLIVLVVPSFANPTPVKSVEIESEKLSFSSNSPGSWKVVKSAKWVSKGKAQITLDVSSVIKPRNEYTDVILVLDTSGSMLGTTSYEDRTVVKLNQLQSDVSNLINEMIPKGNKIALITFNDTSTILSDFTSDSTSLVDNINRLTAEGNTNYYQALINVENILKNYTHQDNRDCVVLFLTDGLPNVDTPNEIPQYQNLKTNYPYLTINAIQYEMGDSTFEAIKKISDNQFVTSVSNLDKFLYRAAVNPVAYDNFVITDYIDERYFTPTKITTTAGEGKLEGNKVTWNLGKIKSGFLPDTTKAVIDVKLKDEFIGTGGVYPTNERLEINSKIRDSIEEVTSTKTPILADSYQITYEENGPEGCSVTNVPKAKKVSVFDTVSITNEEPKCEGYQFKGWKVVTEGVNKVNEDHFIMPEKDVTMRATWGRSSIAKSMEGTIYVKPTLYKVLQDEAESGGVARKYTGTHQDSFNGGGMKNIYHFYASNSTDAVTVKNKNNVIFAGQCWQMVRTTDTGGVKMIYNGEAKDGKCLDTRGTHVGYSNMDFETSQDLNGNYYYGTDYTYDEATKKFSLGGSLTQATWNSSTYPNLIGKYTCASTDSVGTCSTLYYVESYKNTSSAYVLKLEPTSHYSQFGTVPFNMIYDSPAHVGYMYNTSYPYGTMSFSSDMWLFGNDVTYDGSNYTLVNPQSFALSSDYRKVDNYHYTCFSKNGSCTKVYYIYYEIHEFGSNRDWGDPRVYYIELTGGKRIEDALEEMLSADNVNSKNSTMKSAVEAWYEKYLKDYTKYLEDTVYCNNRNVYQLNGWNPNGGSISNDLYFKESNKKDLSCNNVTDRFSILNEKAKLKYPVGLMTISEMDLLGNSDVRKTGEDYWSVSPSNFFGPALSDGASEFYVSSSGYLGSYSVFYVRGVRPSVSLAPSATYSEGDGSMEAPYVVELKN